MAKNLIVVESPSKARTITKYLGKDFKALASYGHVRDLLPKSGAVDTDADFEMRYEIIEKNEKHVDAITKEMAKAEALYLATDPDREGEAISWHLHEILKERNLIADKPVHRVAFYEITKRAIQEAIDNPRELSDELISAQQARRALDYLVGFNLSPLLWTKIRAGLSAGRVQSPALRLICEREAEIDRFVAREYWTVEADVSKKNNPFVARLTHFQGEKLEQFSITDAERAGVVETELNARANGKLLVIKVDKKQRRRNPTPPFTTSTLQQEASRKLGFGAQRTMRIAQQLYEGINLDGETVGLISYMRTDAVNLANDAVAEIRQLIESRYGAKNVPESPQVYKNRSKNAQEAHEAIRPTSAFRVPDEIKSSMTPDQLKLYDLIWKRTVACQMIHATLDTVAVDMQAGEGNVLRANGSTVVDPGFMIVYQEGKDDVTGGKKANGKAEDDGDATNRAAEDKQVMLPEIKEGEEVDLKAIRPEQHFTEPPPRYTEASLVKTLEAHGIGRPSTYASIISTLIYREYVELESRRFSPTDVGKVVNAFLTKHFARYVDYDFTAGLEDELDAISRGEKDWIPVLREFWAPFRDLVDDKKESVSREEAIQSRDLGIDPESGRPVSVRMGRYGPIVQIGTRDDEEKPKFAPLMPGQKMDALTFEDAMELFKLPRKLGETEEGEPVSTNFGRFGPYVKYGSKYVSLKDGNPMTVTLEEALVLVREKKEFDANRVIQVFEDEGIEVLNGRYGPYITNGEKNARVPKETDPKSLTLAECQALLEKAPVRRGKKKAAKKVTKKTAETDEPKVAAAAKKKTKKKKKKKKTKKKTKSAKKVAKKTAKKTAAEASVEAPSA